MSRIHRIGMVCFVVAALAAGLGAVVGSAEEAADLAEALAPLRPLIGKTWKGPFKGSTPEKPLHDVQRWERALNGRAVRVLHSVNDGAYGGESIIFPAPASKELEYYYFTTAGFYTHGTMKADGRRFTSREKVTGATAGAEGGIAEVQAVLELLPDGSLHSKSRYLKGGEWIDGHDVTYTEAPDAKVTFK